VHKYAGIGIRVIPSAIKYCEPSTKEIVCRLLLEKKKDIDATFLLRIRGLYMDKCKKFLSVHNWPAVKCAWNDSVKH